MGFLSSAPIKVDWPTLLDAAAASNAAYSGIALPSGYKNIGMKSLGVDTKNIDGAFFKTSDGGGAARVMQKGNTVILSFRGTDEIFTSKSDVKQWWKTYGNDYLADFKSLIDGINNYIKNNAGTKLVVTGHSLGGWIANKLADSGKIQKAAYIGFESPFVSKNALNIGFSNDLIYRSLSSNGKGEVPNYYVVSDPHNVFHKHSMDNAIKSATKVRDSTFESFMGFTDYIFVNVSNKFKKIWTSDIVGSSSAVINVGADVFVIGDDHREQIIVDLATRFTRFTEAGGGDDTVTAWGSAKDWVVGGDGRDTIKGGDGADHLSGDGSHLDYKAGKLTVDFKAPTVKVAGKSLDLQAELTRLQATDGGLKSGAKDSGNGADVIWGERGDDFLFGGSGNDHLVGGDGNDTLLGGLGSDRLEGGNGHDRLSGGKGADRMVGGRGDDTYLVDNIGDTVVEARSAGIDTVILAASGSFSLDNVEIVALSSAASSVNLTVTAPGQKLLGLNLAVAGNAANNRIGLSYKGTAEIEAAVFGGGGSDTFVFSAPQAKFAEVHFRDIDTNDRIDIRSVRVLDKIGSGTIDVSSSWPGDGRYLISDDVKIRYRDSLSNIKTTAADLFFGTDNDWMIVQVAGNTATVIAEFQGDMTMSNWII